MPISWKENRDENSKRWTSHKGLVVGSTMKVERVMSDIYSEERYAIVWNPNTKQDELKKIGSPFELYQGPWGNVTPDLSPQHQEIRNKTIKDNEERQRKARSELYEKDRIKSLLKIHNTPKKGLMMRVVRGRTTPKGTIGKVFWMDDDNSPSRVGIALSDKTNHKGHHVDVAWVNAAYLENINPLVDHKKYQQQEQLQQRKQQKDKAKQDLRDALALLMEGARENGLDIDDTISVFKEVTG